MAIINRFFIALGFLTLTSIQFVLSRNVQEWNPDSNVGVDKVHKNEYPDLGIINGVKSTIMKPWLGSLWKHNKLACGCSILSSTKILTAAHCLQGDLLASDLKIGVGDLHKDLQTKYTVKSFINHRNYSDVVQFSNDVAIITLEVPIIFIAGSVGPITLNGDCSKKIPVNTKAFIQGWGKQHPDSTVGSDELYEAEIQILSKDDEGCKEYDKKGWLSESMICAGYPHGGIDSCAGDSGGPMTNIFNEQIGIVSWGDGCGGPKAPGVYTEICTVKKWILANWYKTN